MALLACGSMSPESQHLGARGKEDQEFSYSMLPGRFKASLGYMRPCSSNKCNKEAKLNKTKNSVLIAPGHIELAPVARGAFGPLQVFLFYRKSR